MMDAGSAAARDMIPQPAGCCVIRRQKDGYLFYNSETDELHIVPSIGYFIYQLCDGLRTVGEIEQWIEEAIPHQRDLARDAVGRFLDALIARGVLEASHDA
jgi:hypothetical protein